MTAEEVEKVNALAGKFAEEHAKTDDEVLGIVKAFIAGYEAKSSENAEKGQ